jgi:hypothetical protein
MNTIHINEKSMTDAMLLSLYDNGLVLRRDDGKPMPEKYDPVLAMAQALTHRILYSMPVITVVEQDDR